MTPKVSAKELASVGKKKKKKPTAAVKPNQDLFDLGNAAVKTCWERILRLAVVRNKPILVNGLSYAGGYKGLPHPVPGAATFLPRMTELGNKVYFSENIFYFSSVHIFERWTCFNRDIIKLVRKIGFDLDHDLSQAVDGIKVHFSLLTPASSACFSLPKTFPFSRSRNKLTFTPSSAAMYRSRRAENWHR